MKIYSSKLDDLKKARDEWDAETARRDAIREEESAKYHKAQDELIAPIDYEISQALNKFNLLEFDIDVTPSSDYKGGRGVEVRIRCNDRKVHDVNSALSWDWRVNLDDEGNIVKESGSWSGLNATTEESMNSLRQSVQALEYLNSVDWGNLLDVTMPSFKDFFTDLGPRGQKPDFNKQIEEAELEEYVGSDTLLLGNSLVDYESRWNRSVPTWYIILRETPKQYEIGDISFGEAKTWFEHGLSISEIVEKAKSYTSRIRKDRLMNTLNYPYVELNEETINQRS